MSLMSVSCFHCNKRNGFLTKFLDKVHSGKCVDTTLDKLGVRRPCCRNHYITYPEELEELLSLFNNANVSGDITDMYNLKVNMSKMEKMHRQDGESSDSEDDVLSSISDNEYSDDDDIEEDDDDESNSDSDYE